MHLIDLRNLKRKSYVLVHSDLEPSHAQPVEYWDGRRALLCLGTFSSFLCAYRFTVSPNSKTPLILVPYYLNIVYGI